MSFDHDKLDVYRLAIEFIGWAGELLDSSLKKSGMSAANIWMKPASRSRTTSRKATGNAPEQTAADFSISRGSAFECAACLDALAARKRLTAVHGKSLLERIVSMLWRMIEAFQAPSSPSSSPSRSTSTSTRR
jgi:hypothetical protein